MYGEKDDTSNFIKYAAGIQEAGAILPPELMLNEFVPAQPPNYREKAVDYMYSDSEEEECSIVDANGMRVKD